MKKLLFTTVIVLLTAVCTMAQLPDFTVGGYPVDNQTTTVPAVKLNSGAETWTTPEYTAEWIGDVLKVTFTIPSGGGYHYNPFGISMAQWQIPEGGDASTPRFKVNEYGNPNPLYQAAVGQSVDFSSIVGEDGRANAQVSMDILCDSDINVRVDVQGVDGTVSNASGLRVDVDGNPAASETAADGEWQYLRYSWDNDFAVDAQGAYDHTMMDLYSPNWLGEAMHPSAGTTAVPVKGDAITGLLITFDDGTPYPESPEDVVTKTIYIRNIVIGAGYDENGDEVAPVDYVKEDIVVPPVSNFTIQTDEGDVLMYSVNEGDTTVTFDGFQYEFYNNEFVVPETVTYKDKTYSVTAIGNYAFGSCWNLNSITISSALTNLSGLFSSGASLSEINVDKDNSKYSSIDGVLYNKAQDTLVLCPKQKNRVTIPSSVKGIASYAFAGCNNLYRITNNASTPQAIDSTVFEYADIEYKSLYVPTTDIANKYKAANIWKDFGDVSPVIEEFTATTEEGYELKYVKNNATGITECVGMVDKTKAGSADLVINSCVEYNDIYCYVDAIGENAFQGCTGLTGNIMCAVSVIGSNAFQGCTGVTSLAFADNVDSIAPSAFADCYGLTKVINNAENPQVIESNTFYNVAINEIPLFVSEDVANDYKAANVWKLFGSVGSLTEEFTATTDEGYELKYIYNNDTKTVECAGLVNDSDAGSADLVIPSSVSYNGMSYAVTSIGYDAFYRCAFTGSAIIPNSVTAIGEYAFGECAALTEVTIPNSVTTIGQCAFGGCAALIEVTIPNSVTTIGEYAFGGCAALTEVTIPNSVTTIGEEVFYECEALTSITVSSSNPKYSSVDGILYNKVQDTLIICPAGKKGSVTISNSVTTIADYAFGACTGLTEVIISDKVTAIGKYAFSECHELTEIAIPSGLTSIGRNAFFLCSKLSEIGVSKDNANYSSLDGILYNKKQDTLVVCPIGKSGEVTIFDGVTTIKKYAFYECDGLTGTLTIPNSVSTIEECAFAGCSNLDSVIMKSATPPSTGWGIFDRVNANLFVPSGSASDYEQYDGKWEGLYIAYNITTELNGGTFASGVTMPTFYTTRNTTILPIAIKANSEVVGGEYTVYTLQGWDNGTEVITEIPQGTTGDIKLTATWAEEIYEQADEVYNIKTNLNGGVLAAAIPTVYTEESAEIVLPTVHAKTEVIDGKTAIYNFKEWQNASKQVVISIPTGSAGDVELTAVYSLYSLEVPQENGSFIYTVIGKDSVSVSQGSTKPSGKLTIPATIPCDGTDYTVAEIGPLAFYDCYDLKEVTIPNSVTSIGERAFAYCYDLKEVTIPNSVTTIGERAFASCNDLTSVTISSSVITIGNRALGSCYNLTEIEVSKDNAKYSSVDGILYNKDQDTLIACPQGKTAEITIPNNVTTIGNEAFSDCEALTSVTIPNSVTTIGERAFAYCNDLTSVTMQSTTPPSISSGGWSGSFRGVDANVFIPSAAIANYDPSNTSSWAGLSIVAICNITTDLAGGKLAEGETIPATYTEVSETIILPEPTKANSDVVAGKYIAYTFAGWNNGSEVITEIPQGTKGDVTLTATWSEKVYNEADVIYTIKTDLDGGEFADGETIPTTYTEESETIALAEPTKANSDTIAGKYTVYSFDGWNNGTAVVTEIAKGGTSNIKLKAIWSKTLTNVKYSIKVDLADGKLAAGETIPPTYTVDDEVILPEPTKANSDTVEGKYSIYTFGGWSNEFATVTKIEKGNTRNINLTAIWLESKADVAKPIYDIDTDLAGGTLLVVIPETYTEESETILLPSPTRVNSDTVDSKYSIYTFAGWKNSADEIVTEITKGSTGDVLLTATWSEKVIEIADEVYSISLQPNGGDFAEGVTIPSTYTVASETIILPIPTRANSDTIAGSYSVYTFAGWNNGTSVVTEIVKGSTGNVVLVATWSEDVYDKEDVVYNITFELDGGTLLAAIPAIYTEDSETIVLPEPTKANSDTVDNKYIVYTFAGWKNSADETVTEIATGSTGSVELTATWTEEEKVIETTSLEDVAVAKPFTQMGNVLQFAEPTQVVIYSISGAMLYNGVAMEYVLQAKGVYVVATANGSFKVVN